MVLVSNNGLIIINVFVVCLGLTVMGTSAALIYQQYKYHEVLTNAHYAVPRTTLVTGLLLALLAFLGCLGAIKGSPCVLTTYAVVVWIMLVAVLTAGVMLLVFTSDATGFLTDSMTNVFKKYGKDGQEQLTHHLDEFQREAQCCGINGYEDWANFPYGNGTSVADGCCKMGTKGCGLGMLNNPNVTELVWSTGCLDYVYFDLYVICVALTILSFILVGFQALSFTWACTLANDLRRNSDYDWL